MKRGFTLIELLVVISIIGLLSSVVLASVTSVRQKTYNSLIIGEVKDYQNAIEQFLSDHNYIPKTYALECLTNPCLYYSSEMFDDSTANARLSDYFSTHQTVQKSNIIIWGYNFSGLYLYCVDSSAVSNPATMCGVSQLQWSVFGTNCSPGIIYSSDGINSICKIPFQNNPNAGQT